MLKPDDRHDHASGKVVCTVGLVLLDRSIIVDFSFQSFVVASAGNAHREPLGIGIGHEGDFMELQNALDDVDTAFRQLEFAIKLLSFCELGNIKPSDFDTDHIVLLEGEKLFFPRGKFNDFDSITNAATTGVLIAFSASVLVLDDTFSAVGMKSTPEAMGNDGQLRTLIYMARCAYAHGIAAPRWEVRVSIAVPLVSTSAPPRSPVIYRRCTVRNSWLINSEAILIGTAFVTPLSGCSPYPEK